MSKYIPRAMMPQIDAADSTALVEWLTWEGVDVVSVMREPDSLRFHQKVDWDRVHSMDPETYSKPIWISSDGYVLDGNHRAWAHKLNGEKVWCLVICQPFHKSIDLLFTFAGTYTYGDGKQHAER